MPAQDASSGSRDAQLRARVLLGRLAEPGTASVGRLVAEIGPEAVVAALRRGQSGLRCAPDLTARLSTADPDVDLERATQAGARVVIPGDREWPTQVDDLGDRRPLLLWVRGAGDLRLLALRSVSVVGARAATAYGVAVAATLAEGLARATATVVSGGAFGIDAAAHRAALAVDGATIAMLACGVDVAYPRAHDALLARIADDGLLVSEAPPGAAAHKHRFLQRNRLIAALTRGTVVVEAALRSGSLRTAREAAALGRPVLGVPGPVTSMMSAGVHDLIRQGEATLVTAADEVLEVAGDYGTDLAAVRSGPARPTDDLTATQRRVLDALPVRTSASVSALSASAGVATPTLLASLGVLAARGLAQQDAAGWRISGAPRRA
ncbi:MAG: DNA-protecting protein DprA [Actinomycetota bacterium]|nr:MAG: DNA-protecting protein DprA [Actinomycetota bacterium]